MSKKKILRITAIVSALLGGAILIFVLFPIFSYQKNKKEKFTPQLNSPLVSEEQETPENRLDYTKASNWFEGGAGANDFVSNSISYYTLTIPKLKIDQATVAIGGEDLAEYMIQYPGTALPGKRGNTVIFGHSILPQFYDPKNYLSIFSTLPTLTKGDEVIVSYDGITYQYRIEEMFEVTPTDIQVLEQNLSDSFLTLVTCVPPGHPLKPKRLVVRARIVPLGEANANTRS